VGGPFNPSSITYTLTNTGGSSLDWTAGKSQNWLSLSVTNGTLAAGASTTVTVSINENANSLAAGSYSDTVSFVNRTTAGQTLSIPVGLAVYEIVLTLAQNELVPAEFELILHGQPSQSYVLETSSDLAQWTAVLTNTAGVDGVLTYLESPPAPQRFYRARTQP
jgi:hypothetical protein